MLVVHIPIAMTLKTWDQLPPIIFIIFAFEIAKLQIKSIDRRTLNASLPNTALHATPSNKLIYNCMLEKKKKQISDIYSRIKF